MTPTSLAGIAGGRYMPKFFFTSRDPTYLERSNLHGVELITPLTKARRQLLVQLENILGNECYNGSIQNYGPGGVREAEGRAFRYPITLRSNDGATVKIRRTIPMDVSDEMMRRGYYSFGANQLDVMEGLEKILRFLEQHYGLRVDDFRTPTEAGGQRI